MKRLLVISIIVAFSLPVLSAQSQKSNLDQSEPNAIPSFSTNNALLVIEATMVKRHPKGYYYTPEAIAGGGSPGAVSSPQNGYRYSYERNLGENTYKSGSATGIGYGRMELGGHSGSGSATGSLSTDQGSTRQEQYNLQNISKKPPTREELNKAEVKRLNKRLQLALEELGYIREKAEEENAMKTIEAIDILKQVKQDAVKTQCRKVMKQKQSRKNSNIQLINTNPSMNVNARIAKLKQEHVKRTKKTVRQYQQQQEAMLAEMQNLQNIANIENAEKTTAFIKILTEKKNNGMKIRILSTQQLIAAQKRDHTKMAEIREKKLELLRDHSLPSGKNDPNERIEVKK